MKNLRSITSNSPTPSASAARSSPKEDGFQKQLNEILLAAKEKEAAVKGSRKENLSYSLVEMGNQKNAAVSAQTHLSANMLGLYRAQENKNEKSGKGRAVQATSVL